MEVMCFGFILYGRGSEEQWTQQQIEQKEKNVSVSRFVLK